MNPALQIRTAAALPPPPDAGASLPFAAAVASLPTHQRPPLPAIGVDNPLNQDHDDTLTTTTASSSSATVISITMTTSTSSSIFSPSPTAFGSGGDPDNSNGECRLLGPFALFVQLALGGLALLALVYKRWRERPQRPLKIWFFDVSKQVFGSVLVHVANVFMSMLTSGRFDIKLAPTPARNAVVMLAARAVGVRGDGDDGYTPNPCSFYLLNLAIDTTLGIPILILLLRIYTSLVALTPLGKPRESIQSGNYGRPPNAWWWLKQSFIYFCGLFGMKICVLIIFLTMPWISRVGDWALGWTEGNEKLQVAFVMMIFPLIMNAMQYYIIDSFIKLKETASDGDGDSDDGSDTSSEGGGEVYAGVASGSDGDDESEDEEVDKKKTRAAAKVSPRIGAVEDREYDPEVDGDSQTVIGSSSSQTRDERGRLLPKELFPKE